MHEMHLYVEFYECAQHMEKKYKELGWKKNGGAGEIARCVKVLAMLELRA